MLSDKEIMVINKSLKELEKQEQKKAEEDKALWERRMLLLCALEKGIIPKPIKNLEVGAYFKVKKVFYCPLCGVELEKKVFQREFSLFNKAPRQYFHLICPNNDYEVVIG